MSRLIQSSLPTEILIQSSTPPLLSNETSNTVCVQSNQMHTNLSSAEPIQQHRARTYNNRNIYRKENRTDQLCYLEKDRNNDRNLAARHSRIEQDESLMLDGKKLKEQRLKDPSVITTTTSSHVDSFRAASSKIQNDIHNSDTINKMNDGPIYTGNEQKQKGLSIIIPPSCNVIVPTPQPQYSTNIAESSPPQFSQLPLFTTEVHPTNYRFNQKQSLLSFPTEPKEINPSNNEASKRFDSSSISSTRVAFTCSESGQESGTDSTKQRRINHRTITSELTLAASEDGVINRRIGIASHTATSVSLDRGRTKTYGRTAMHRGTSLDPKPTVRSSFDTTPSYGHRSPANEDSLDGTPFRSHNTKESYSYLRQKLNALHEQQRNAASREVKERQEQSLICNPANKPNNDRIGPRFYRVLNCARTEESYPEAYAEAQLLKWKNDDNYNGKLDKQIQSNSSETAQLPRFEDHSVGCSTQIVSTSGNGRILRGLPSKDRGEVKSEGGLGQTEGRRNDIYIADSQDIQYNDIPRDIKRASDGLVPRPNKTRSQLAALQDKIMKFEGQLQIETEHRRAMGEGRLNVLREAVGALEKTLEAEVRRRVDAHKTIQMGFEDQLSSLESKIDKALEKRHHQMTSTLDSLTVQVKTAEASARETMEAQAVRIRQLGGEVESVASEIQKIKDHISNEFQARRQRSEIMSDKLTELEKQIETRVNIERSVRERDVQKLNESIGELHHHHISLDDQFQHNLAAKFLELKTALKEEIQAREQADDDIVQALNHYTVALQSALRIANSSS